MPRVEICHYRAVDGRVPVRDWLRDLKARNAAAYKRCRRAIVLLAASGWDLRRPHADYLRDAIYELRVRSGRMQIRILYFFSGRSVVVLASALVKEDIVPASEIERAIRRRHEAEAAPEAHLLRGWSTDE